MDVPFPLLSAPGGQRPQVAGGRLINCYPETLPATAGKPYAYWRVPGLGVWATAPSGRYRGGLLVAGTFYAVFGTTVYSYTAAGGEGVAIAGSVPGTGWVSMAANMASPANVVLVSPGIGAFIINATPAVANYPDANIGQPNYVLYHQSFFVFTYGNGQTRTSNPQSTVINTQNVATAENKADTLYRPIPLGNGQLLLAGANTIEVWGGLNDTGYPFSYVATIPRGIAGPQAIAGNEDGWGKGLFIVGDDNKVSTLSGYTPTPISTPDLDRLIEKEADKTKISIGVYVSRGHGFVVVQGPTWCWEYDTTLTSWHERRSHLKEYWRGYQPIYVFGKWLCGDTDSASLAVIDGNLHKEFGQPLRMRIETGPLGAFPNAVRVNTIELYMTKGASNALGAVDEIDAMLEVAISRDGGQSFTKPRQLKIGQQSLTNRRARASIWGQAEIQGVRWRFDESAGVNFGFMGADMLADKLR
ncbi:MULTISPECIES: hypothetical protein [unclassified Bradyrhizobium]|uniref:hypothetical protein n=1 Tax=unclassified Bradyrhizobium TaxID=2631580 RepID=UPI002FEF9A5A